MRPVNQGVGHASYSTPATLTFRKGRATDISAVLGTVSPTLEQCLRDVWLVVAKVMARPPANIAALNKALDAIEPRVGRIYKKAAAPLLSTIGCYCSYCESPLGALAEVEHAVPKSEFPLFATTWKNFLLACGPCNTSKLIRPSRVELRALKGGVDLDPDEEVSYGELRSKYIDWPDRNPRSCQFVDYELQRLDAGSGSWVTVAMPDATDLSNSIVRTNFTKGLVFANLPSIGQVNVPVRVHIGTSNARVSLLIRLCKLNTPSGANPSYDRREMNRTMAWFEVLRTLSNLLPHTANPGVFTSIWNMAMMHARTLGFYSVWIKLLAIHVDPGAPARTLAHRFVVEAAANFPGTVTSHLP